MMNREYERPEDKPIINIQFILIIILCIGIFWVMFGPILFPKHIEKPVNLTNVTPALTSQIIQIEYVTVLVTPTPDGITYWANEYQNGTRKLGRVFSWIRHDVSGLKDMSVHVTAYDYKVFDSYTWFNPQDYKYYKQYPLDKNDKFVFVFVQIYMDDVIGSDPRMWLPDSNHYALQAKDTIYQPIDFVKQLRIKELENTHNLNDDNNIGYYATVRKYSSAKEHMITAGETYEELTYLRGGKSNAVDGYIVFEIPKDIPDSQLFLLGDFYAFGNAAWKLQP